MKILALILAASTMLCQASAQFIFKAKKPITTNLATIDRYETIARFDSIPFSSVRVVDCRLDTTGIGFYLDGYLTLTNGRQPMALQQIINQYYGKLFTPNRDTMIIQLNTLNIQEKIIEDTAFYKTTARLRCTEYIGKNNQYNDYTTIDTLMTERNSHDGSIPKQKDERHLNYELWDHYLLRLCEAMLARPQGKIINTHNITPPYFTLAEIQEQSLGPRNKPILTCDTLKPGFYRNFEEFVANQPTFTYENENNLKKLLEVMHYRVNKNISNEAPDTSYWGFCDGKKLFVRYEYNFYELEKHDCAFYIAPTLDARRKYFNRQGWNMLIGLAMLTTGIVAKEGITFVGFNTVHMPDTPLVAIPFGGSYATGLLLDMDTGKITF